MTSSSSVADVDAWITQLQDCKQLSENDIRRLCEKVKKEKERKSYIQGCCWRRRRNIFLIFLYKGA